MIGIFHYYLIGLTFILDLNERLNFFNLQSCAFRREIGRRISLLRIFQWGQTEHNGILYIDIHPAVSMVIQ